jgi:hypothetical protein
MARAHSEVEPGKIEPVGNGAHPAEGVKDTRSPDEIEAALDRTRTHLSETLDELSERLDPRDLARRGGRRIKAQFVDEQTGRVRPAPVGAAAGGLGAVVGTVVALRKLRGHS